MDLYDLHESTLDTVLEETEKQMLCGEINEQVGKTLEYMVIKRLVPKSTISDCFCWCAYTELASGNFDFLFITFSLVIELEVYQDNGELSKSENLHFHISGQARYTRQGTSLELKDLRLDTTDFMRNFLGWDVEFYPKDIV
ncbi:MAG TPA: hypothetical protein ENH10_02660 [Bacteroidetes bacterium]|nr:hypothetical protein BMS3Bbin04_00006 [bacterium BMS3Bbin04]HDO64917.1 hypothetical protein [Bacteroidota bacterium]HEX04042.1 hypothetical protein [Bacteroidota bacterium]